ncbi:MAG: hypothetical protein A2W90_00490 [Bacteroidetes bacterium GWF2_42_66]|nr:MAG: hypothetical protein A2W92_21675 [Bacteroidetes bacterium GWA2_42_15]OFY02101.1 MAG: hypothetical protein A2W89_11675 [Bacteroidetes bacterium GWE2_42_39]OFY43448.1 MAG: hypothetical protein A2W90_00490 [Bacteroidetes bacterium GWF2_42_66]HBL76532.1 GHMP kinase [Prolixibacteraceae bacterium]HCR92270.1 GHMP kinase [Prolixibacteraceae bacterium]
MPKPPVDFFANGKLLLTAEYFVLHGAKALALPVKFGQSLKVIPPGHYDSSVESHQFSWQSFFHNERWFSGEFDSDHFSIKKASDWSIAETLVQLLKTVREINPQFQIEAGTTIKTVLDFNPKWGLGSSSTLVANLSEWAGADPFLLNEKVFNGSGFDIACAKAAGPVFYRKGQKAEPVFLKYPFSENLFFVYSGKKKNTREAISAKRIVISEEKKEEISALTDQFSACKKLNDFQKLIKIHEQEVAALIGQEPIQQLLFPDFWGAVKSLGAWGGDFLLVAADRDFRQVKTYFSEKGMTEVFKWEEMVLTPLRLSESLE